MRITPNKLSLVALVTIISLILIVAGKLLVDSSFGDNGLLYWYGITVTSAILVIFFVTYSYYRDPYERAMEIKKHRGTGEEDVFKEEPTFVSCLVAAYNEEGIIDRCVESILAQSYPEREIIFVDDNSTDKTGEILDKYAITGKIRVIHLTQNVGKKQALAQAMAAARGELFAFSDSDTVLAPDAIERAVAIFDTHPDVGAVSGHSRPLNASKNLLTKVQDTWYEGQFSVRKAYESVFGSVQCVSGPLAVFRRAAIYNFIPAWIHDSFLGTEFKFATDRTLTAFVLGSKSLGAKIKQKYHDSPFVREVDYPLREWKVVYSKSTRAWTEVPDTWRRMLKQQIRWKKSFLRSTFFTGKFYWRKPFPTALMFYLHILFVFVGPFIVFRHLIYLPLRGNVLSGVLYISGILFIGLLFAFAHKKEDPTSRYWVYRPLMNIISTFFLSWLVFYSAVTIRKMTWSRG